MTIHSLRHLLCPVDFSESSDAATDCAISLARKCGAMLSLLHVAEQPTFATPGHEPALSTSTIEGRERELAERLANYAQSKAVAAGGNVSSHLLVVDKTSVQQSIVESALALNASLIVMGTHGRSGIKRLLYGSTLEAVLRQSPIPVLAVPAASHPRHSA